MSLFSKLYVTRAEFLATYKSSQPVLLTRSLTTCSCTGSSSHKLFYSFSRQLSTSNQVATYIYSGTVALRQEVILLRLSQLLSKAILLHHSCTCGWIANLTFLLFESVYTNGTEGGGRACTNKAWITSWDSFTQIIKAAERSISR
jgi:hypothetical protein